MSKIIETVQYAEFSAGQAAKISGVNAPLQRHWRARGLLPDIEPGKHARFGPDDVLHMTIMQAFSDSNISIKGARIFTKAAADIAKSILQTLPGAVEFVADYSLGHAFINHERRRLKDWRDMSGARYLFMPLPEREDASGRIVMYKRKDLSDLHTLLDEDGFHGLLIDVEALARAFLDRALRVNTFPLETRSYTLEQDGAK